MEIETIRKDQVFYECPQGYNYEYTALTDAYRYNEGWKVDVLTKNGQENYIYVHDIYRSYLRLYNSPQYVTMVGGKMDFVIE